MRTAVVSSQVQNHPIVETLESRRLLSSAAGVHHAMSQSAARSHPKPHPHPKAVHQPIKHPTSTSAPAAPLTKRADATSSSSEVHPGPLVINGTPGNDVIRVSIDPRDASRLDVVVNGVTTRYALAAITGIRISSGQGNDDVETNELNGAVTIPMTLVGGNGNDTLVGGSGNDSITAGNGKDVLAGEAGNDTLVSGNGRDLLLGGSGDDLLTAGNGQDTLSGDGGADTLIAGNGADDLQPGPDGIVLRGKAKDHAAPAGPVAAAASQQGKPGSDD
jgi:hypothetical protein